MAAEGGQDRDGPLLAEGRLLSGHESQQRGKWARGGRRIVRRPARLRQAIGGPDRVPGPTLRPDPQNRGSRAVSDTTSSSPPTMT